MGRRSKRNLQFSKVKNTKSDFSSEQKDFLSKNKEKVKQMLELKEDSNFERSFPKVAQTKGTRAVFCYNDYHSKASMKGYARNEYGKPFFS